jgi:hypothetical protein
MRSTKRCLREKKQIKSDQNTGHQQKGVLFKTETIYARSDDRLYTNETNIAALSFQ